MRIINLCGLIDLMTSSVLTGRNRDHQNREIRPQHQAEQGTVCVPHVSLPPVPQTSQLFMHACSHVAVHSPPQLLYTFDKQVCVSSCSLNKEETLLGESLVTHRWWNGNMCSWPPVREHPDRGLRRHSQMFQVQMNDRLQTLKSWKWIGYEVSSVRFLSQPLAWCKTQDKRSVLNQVMLKITSSMPPHRPFQPVILLAAFFS